MDYDVLLNPFFLTYLIGGIAMLAVGIAGVSLQLSLSSKGLRKYGRRIRFFYLFSPSRWESHIEPSDLHLFKKSRRIDFFILSSLLGIWLVQAALGQFFLCQALDVADARELLRQQPMRLSTMERFMIKVCLHTQ